jgi:hypothetical protein
MKERCHGGQLKFRAYNPDKTVKYGLLVKMVCESRSRHICSTEIYTAQGKKVEDSWLQFGTEL